MILFREKCVRSFLKFTNQYRVKSKQLIKHETNVYESGVWKPARQVNFAVLCFLQKAWNLNNAVGTYKNRDTNRLCSSQLFLERKYLQIQKW